MMIWLLLPFLVQVLVISIDEFYFHHKRGLPKWERIGHPLDTLSVLLCFLFVLCFSFSSTTLPMYVILALFSCVFVTKDEFIHKECCPASEQWLHAFLFINHPIVLTAAALIWPVIDGASLPQWMTGWQMHADLLRKFLIVQAVTIGFFLSYQIFYWNVLWKEKDENTE
jgi:cytochrome bd-type quinol oxidase subunit 2